MCDLTLLKPYKGVSEITFDMSYDEVRRFLKDNTIRYNVDVWPNKGCDPEVPWKIIRVEGGLSIFFAKDKMFKITASEEFKGALLNGIKVEMPLSEVMLIDSTIGYDEINEDYESEKGYWLEIDSDEKVESITVFIKELLDEEEFFSYKWTN